MRYISPFLILIVFVFGTACDNEIIDREANFEFETIDNEANKIDLIVTIRYRLISRLDKTLSRKYGRHYRDSIFLPAVKSVSKKVLKDYSAGEIYNYKRDEIKQKLEEQTKTTFAKANIELTTFLIRSVKLSDTVMRRLEREYVTKFENAIKKCSREVKGVVTKIDSLKKDARFVFYEFIVERKNYESILSRDEDSAKVGLGDTLLIEYACEEPSFHRLKK